MKPSTIVRVKAMAIARPVPRSWSGKEPMPMVAVRVMRPGRTKPSAAEPPAADHPLFGLPNVVLTPHNAALTVECAERMALASVQNVLDFFAGRLDPALIVNKGFQ